MLLFRIAKLIIKGIYSLQNRNQKQVSNLNFQVFFDSNILKQLTYVTCIHVESTHHWAV